MFLLFKQQVVHDPRPSLCLNFSTRRFWNACLLVTLAMFCASPSMSAQESNSAPWSGIVTNNTGAPVGGATVQLVMGKTKVVAKTGTDGKFRLPSAAKGSYSLSVEMKGVVATYAPLVTLPQSESLQITIQDTGALSLKTANAAAASSGGEQLSGKDVSGIPLNKRDFSQLLLLAAGTMTDTNGSTNFTAQFAINGPEMGGATFSNFNVDAVQEIQSSSGWMPAEIGRGAAGFTNIVTRSGSSGFHGSMFEFIRNSALDARNYFDHTNPEDPRRIPPFQRNEFGFTNGGPVIIPHIYDGRGKTFYFGEYQGFRQNLGTTQVLPVPTADERAGLDSTAYPGDVLYVPVNTTIAPDINRYPLPNDPTGAFGVHTFATSSKVITNADQFAIRLDQKISDKAQLLIRFNYNNLNGPTTNPDQTAIDPTWGVQYLDRQRNGVVTYTRT